MIEKRSIKSKISKYPEHALRTQRAELAKIQVEKIEKEYTQKKRDLSDAHKKMIAELQASLDTLSTEVERTQELIGQKDEIQEEFKVWEDRMIAIKLEHNLKLEEIKLAEGLLKTRNNQLDEYKGYLQELSGKLTNRLRIINELSKEVNDKLSKRKIARKLDIPMKALKNIPF